MEREIVSPSSVRKLRNFFFNLTFKCVHFCQCVIEKQQGVTEKNSKE